MDAQPQPGFIIWITGMHGAGKSALGRHLARKLQQAGRAVELLDADDPGEILTAGLPGGPEGREVAVRRVGSVALRLMRHGVAAVCAAVSPMREPREALRREARRFVEVFVDCPMETLSARDPIYERAMKGEVRNVPGVDDPYEPPSRPELVVHTDLESIEAAAGRVFQALVDLRYLAPAEFSRGSGGQRPKRARSPARKKAAPRALRKAPRKPAVARSAARARARRRR